MNCPKCGIAHNCDYCDDWHYCDCGNWWKMRDGEIYKQDFCEPEVEDDRPDKE